MIEADREISSELFLNGKILTFNKPVGWSSFDLVKKRYEKSIVNSAGWRTFIKINKILTANKEL